MHACLLIDSKSEHNCDTGQLDIPLHTYTMHRKMSQIFNTVSLFRLQFTFYFFPTNEAVVCSWRNNFLLWIVNSSVLPILKIYSLDFSSVLKKELYLISVVTIFSIILIILDTYGVCYILASRIIYFYNFFLFVCVCVLPSKF